RVDLDAMVRSSSLVPLASFSCWQSRSTPGPSHYQPFGRPKAGWNGTDLRLCRTIQLPCWHRCNQGASDDFAKICDSGARVDAIADGSGVLPNGRQDSPCGPLTDSSEVVVGLTPGFSKRGYVVGRSLIYERRAAEAHPERLPGLVDDLKRAAELIISQSYAAARVVKDRSNVPVVAITGADPIGTGLVDSLARPGGTVTGVGEIAAELSAKRLEVLK